MRRRLQVEVTLWVHEELVLGQNLRYLLLPVLQTQTMLNLYVTRCLLPVSVHPPHQIQVLRMTRYLKHHHISGEIFVMTDHNFILCCLRSDILMAVSVSCSFLGYRWLPMIYPEDGCNVFHWNAGNHI
jgi:hypothetical protein